MAEGSSPKSRIPASAIVPGARHSYERIFTVEEVRAFGEVTGDLGRHHLEPDDRGRVIVQGLLVAAIPTRTGGEMNFLARELSFEFLRPVFTGDRVLCETRVLSTTPEPKRLRVEVAWECTNQDQAVVMRGHGTGVVRT
jgi:acyl dehydratase